MSFDNVEMIVNLIQRFCGQKFKVKLITFWNITFASSICWKEIGNWNKSLTWSDLLMTENKFVSNWMEAVTSSAMLMTKSW